MARRASLKPQLNQIRIWVQQGRTDAWIAHALGSTPASISSFRNANGIKRSEANQSVEAVSFETADLLSDVELPDLPVPEEFLAESPSRQAQEAGDGEGEGAGGARPRRSRRRRRGEGDEATNGDAGEPTGATAETPAAPALPPVDPSADPTGLAPVPYETFISGGVDAGPASGPATAADDDETPAAAPPRADAERDASDGDGSTTGTRPRRSRRRRRGRGTEGAEGGAGERDLEPAASSPSPPQADGRERSARGEPSRRGGGTRVEGVFEHGGDGWAIWLDAAVAETGVYAEHWAGRREVEVTVEADRIVVRRSGGAPPA